MIILLAIMVVGEFICGVTLDDANRLIDFDREHDLSIAVRSS
jgi:hypothetical protein